MICSFCEEKATVRCSVCDDIFCPHCGRLHLQALGSWIKLDSLDKEDESNETTNS